MFLNYIKITLRNLYKEKMYAAINIAGLSIGIACCIILGLFLRSELTYDRYNLKHKRIFEIESEFNTNGKISYLSTSSRVLAPLLARDYPEIESYVRFKLIGRTLVRYEEESFYSTRVALADDTVFDIFTYDIIYGDPKTALSDPHSMAISESFAKKIFGDINPIGKVIATDSDLNKITLVFADLPENSFRRYDALLSINRLQDDEDQFKDLLKLPFSTTYLLMPEGYKAESFQGKVESIYSKYAGESMETEGVSVRGWLQPIAEIHQNPEVPVFTAVAIFILLVACINYINLATARSMKRDREVGMRKVLGATRPQLIAQFLGESIFLTMIALLIGLVIVEAVTAFSPVNDLLGRQELMNFYDEPNLLLWMMCFGLVVGLISGIYPAFYLSSVQPLSTLTGTTRSGKHSFRMRQSLMLIQFIISMAVIISMILMVLQMQYVSNKPLGFKKENKAEIRLQGAELIGKYPIIKNELLKDSRILDVSGSRTGTVAAVPSRSYIEDNDGVIGEPQVLNFKEVKEDFIKTMGMEIVRGRDFSSDLSTNIGNSALVTESLVKKMGWEEPLGKRIENDLGMFKVIGVVKDFHYRSLHEQMEPLVIINVQIDSLNLSSLLKLRPTEYLVAHISNKDISGALKYIENVFKNINPKSLFEYEFLEDYLDGRYRRESRLMKLIGIFAGICILISCLGLFGLAALDTEQRTKEIGVRKVLGSSTFQIIVMLSRGILLIVLAASVIASLIAYYIIDEWLTNFAYHIGINPIVFVLSVAIAIAVAFGTVALQSFKTANENPVKALRYE